jgi:hypothetical protein
VNAENGLLYQQFNRVKLLLCWAGALAPVDEAQNKKAGAKLRPFPSKL